MICFCIQLWHTQHTLLESYLQGHYIKRRILTELTPVIRKRQTDPELELDKDGCFTVQSSYNKITRNGRQI